MRRTHQQRARTPPLTLAATYFVGSAGHGASSGVSGKELATPLFSMPTAPKSSTLPRSRVSVMVWRHSVTSHPAHPGRVDDRCGSKHPPLVQPAHQLLSNAVWVASTPNALALGCTVSGVCRCLGLAESVESHACASGLSQPSDTFGQLCRTKCDLSVWCDRHVGVREHRAAAHSPTKSQNVTARGGHGGRRWKGGPLSHARGLSLFGLAHPPGFLQLPCLFFLSFPPLPAAWPSPPFLP